MMKAKLRMLLVSLSLFSTSLIHAQSVALLAMKSQPDQAERSLSDALRDLENHYQVRFNYANEIVANTRVRTTAGADNLEQSLQKLLNPLDLSYEKVKDNVFFIFRRTQLKKLEKKPAMRASSAYAPTRLPLKQVVINSGQPMLSIEKTITGKVTDLASDETLPGVNVLVKGTTIGTVTDVEGNYRLTAPDDAEMLVFSSVGYIAEEVLIGNQTVINISLSPDIQSLSEVVVVGYGTQQKRDVVSAISTIDAEQIEKVPTPSFTQALQGTSTGLQMVSPSGEPNAPARILIRGVGSITTDTEPLFIVDGIPVQSGGTSPLTYLNPNDIESISVLKDASATAIYGSRGANGVVLITTKTGKKGQAQFNLSYNVGYTTPINELELANADEWRSMIDLARNNSGLTEPFRKEQDLFDQRQVDRFVNLDIYNSTNTDWVDLVQEDGQFSQYGFSASNATEKASYFISGQYRDQTGNFINTRFQRYTGRVNLDFNATDFLTLGVRYTYSFEDEEPRARQSSAISRNDRNINLGAWPNFSALYDRSLPIFPERWPDNGDAFDPLSRINIPYAADRANSQRNVHTTTQLASLFAEVTPVAGLVLRGEGGVNYSVENDQNWISGNLRPEEFRDEDNGLDDRFLLDYPYEDGVPRFDWYDTRRWTFNFVGTAAYNTEFGADHRLDALLGIEVIHSDAEAWNNQWEDAASIQEPDQVGAFIRDPEQLLELTHFMHPQVRFFSQFGRVNYTFKDRYLLQASLRRDGSSKFTPEDRFSWFPSVSGGWVISDEGFFDIDPLSFLKVRAGWGVTGNANIDPFLYTNDFWPWPNYPNRSGARTLRRLGSRNIQWERSNTFDAALEFGLFDDRISGSFGYYYTRTSDLLLSFPVAPSIGIYATNSINPTALDNVGSMENQGIELEINSVNVDIKGFRWATNFNITTNRNKVLELYPGFDGDPLQLSFNGFTTVQEGESLGMFFLPEFAGYDESGNVLIREIDQELAAEQQYVFTGNTVRNTANNRNANSVIQYGKTGLPTFYGGFNNTFSYKGLSLNILFTFQGGHYLYDNIGLNRVGNGRGNLRKDMVNNTWTPENPDAEYAVLTWNNLENNPPDPDQQAQNLSTRSTKWLKRGDFARLRTINLSYTLPQRLFEKNFLKGVNVFVNLQNVATFSEFDMVDPEVVNTNGEATQRNLGQGVVGGVPYWQVFTASGGVNIQL
ncbi:SusC/RagA family TonB-linked outer membrane protein [Tunicatimonas pelagia]|uniref:SusC/RagA family TonB-linked outer membrane protein n=1 Tax=Tunicatimonas pelagia TaxID=931531 RepID=UPI0026661550|nr:TonB-dependent receptor [Tunicatimonas pelagia]WKN44883.1 TonB-dependent receptor [Tunicatimonas pelagia]